MRVALLLALVACSKGATPSPEATGTLTVDGNPVTIVACRPGHNVHTFVELVTSRGLLRFEDTQLYWNPDREAITRGAPLACSRLGRSWGGGNRVDGSSYWRGRLVFSCQTPTVVAGDLTLDCGHITDEERRELDKHRQDLLDEQKAPGSGGS